MTVSNDRLNEIRRTLAEMINAPGFAEEAERQAKLLRGAPEELEAADFIDAILADWADDLDWPPLD
jgi:hypothetical protein